MRGARDAEHVADDDRTPRDRGLPHRRHRPHALLDRPALLGLEADRKAGTVDEIEDREVKRLREVDEPFHLLARVRGPGAPVEERIARHDGDGPAVDSREPGDDRAPVERSDLDDRSHPVDLARVARDRGAEPVLATVGIVRLRPARGHFVDRRRQVREEPPRTRERLVLGVDRVVDGARAEMDLPAAQLVLGQLLPQALDDRRPGDEHRRLLLHHDRVVRRRQMRGAEAGDRAEPERDARDRAHVVDDPFPARGRGNVRASGRLDRLHGSATARPFDETDQG